MMREKITKSLQGRILLISMIGLVACILSLYMVSSITIQSVEQHRLENSLMANMSNEMDHLEFCYFTMVRMMQQMGEDGSIGSMLEDYLYSENNFEKYQRRRELENEIVSIGFINNYVNLAIYIDSDTKEELFDSVAFKDKDFAAGCVMQIGENQFQALHKSKRKSSEIVVVSLLEERQVFDGRTLDIYIEMKSNIEDYAPRGGASYLSMQLDENGKVLFSNSDLFARDQVLDLALDEDGSFSGGFGDYYLVAKRSDMGFIYVNGVPQEEYLKEMIAWYEKIFLLCVLTAIPALLIMLATRNMLGRPIKSLEQAIEEVGEGKLEPVSEDLEVREFRELMHKINEMWYMSFSRSVFCRSSSSVCTLVRRFLMSTLEVEEGEYLETETIRMLLQPLIENALRYGLGDMGVVDIRIFQDERKDCAVITIQDHGSGLSREKLEQLNRPFCYKNNGDGDTAGIGLRYVRHCLEGFYKGESILTINSEIGRGTKVTIIIPVRIAKEHT